MSNLQKKRKEAKLTQRQLAERSGQSIRSLQYYEQGVLDINKAAAATVFRLAWALGCQMEELLDLDAIMVDETVDAE